MLIQFAKAVADQVRSKPTAFAALEPVLLLDGSYILGVEVMADPAHVLMKAKLQACPQVTEASVASKMPTSTKTAQAASK